MSNNVIQSRDSTGKSSVHPKQSPWMAHWMQTSYKSSPETHDPLSHRHNFIEDGHDISKSSIGVREVTPVKILNGNNRSSNNSDEERINSQSFSKFSQTRKSPVIMPEGTSENLGKIVKCQYFLEKNRLVASKSFRDEFKDSTSNAVHGFSSEKMQEQVNQSDAIEPLTMMVNVVVSVADSKNESSSETEIMDMDDFKENYHLPDPVTSLPNKAVNNVSSSQPKLSKPSEELSERVWLDINEEPPAEFATASPIDKGESSSSKTQSLDIDNLLSKTGNQSIIKSITSPFGTLESTPSSRWVKRLKMTSPDSLFAHGTKISEMGQASSSHDKKGNPLFRISKKGNDNGSSSEVDLEKKFDHEIMLSHSWVRRWCSSNSSSQVQKNNETVVICEPQSLKMGLKEFQKKDHFPSIAAMALMGKAMSGFRPCEFRKMGSLVVWDTKEL